MKKTLLLILAICLFYPCVQAQKDTEFWFACPNIVSGTGAHSDNHMKLCFISYDEPTLIRIEQPAADPSAFYYFPTQTILMQPNQLTQFDLTPYKNYLKDNLGGVKPYGLYISADHEIMAYFINTSDDCEAYTLKGKNALGTEFVVPMQYDYQNSYSGHNFIEIVATEDNTDVTIQLMPGITVQNITPDAQNQIHLTLQKGYIYSMRSTSDTGPQHLHNTRISSNKPIAVNTTDDGVSPGDLMGDQILPVDMLGTKYIAVKNDGQTEYLYFFATEDDTHITVYAGSSKGPVEKTYTLNVGQFGAKVSRYTFSQKKIDALYKAVYIEADKPIVVFQMTGEEPAGAILPQLECTGSQEVAFQSVLDKVWADIIVKADYVDGFLVNNDPTVLTAADFDTVPGTNKRWYWARKEFVPNAVLRVKNTKGFFHLGMYDMRGNSSSLAYFSDFKGAELNATSMQGYYLGSDTLLLSLYDHNSYTNVIWSRPDGTVYYGDSLKIPNPQPSDAGFYYVTADHVDGCTLSGGSLVVTNVFNPTRSDYTNCAGEEITLTNDFGYAPYSWSKTTATTQSVNVSPTDTTSYLTTSQQAGHTIIYNGDFQYDTLNFQSGYINTPAPLNAAEQFCIVTNAHDAGSQLKNLPDHTYGDEQGKQLVALCSDKAGVTVWSKELSVLPNTSYLLSVWSANPRENGANAQLSLQIDGQVIGNTFSPVSSVWTEYTQQWQGTTKEKVTFSIHVVSGTAGNSYIALDDITMTPLFAITDTMQVNVLPLPRPYISGDPYLCNGTASLQTDSIFAAYQWTDAKGNIISNRPSAVITQSGTYTLQVTDPNTSCVGDTVFQMDDGVVISTILHELPVICADQTEVAIPYEVMAGSLGHVAVEFDNKAIQAGFSNESNLSFSDNEVFVPIPQQIRPNNYSLKLQFFGDSDCGGQQLTEQDFTIRYAAEQIMQQKWDDVIALYDADHNGGYTFTNYQWYKNGQPLEGETQSFLYLSQSSLSPDDAYSCLLTRDDGVTLFSCDFLPATQQRSNIPSLLSAATKLSINLTEETVATFYTLCGEIIAQQRLSPDNNQLTIPAAKGFYLLQLKSNDTNKTHKILID